MHAKSFFKAKKEKKGHLCLKEEVEDIKICIVYFLEKYLSNTLQHNNVFLWH